MYCGLTRFFPCHFDGSLVENDGKSHGILITFPSNSMEFSWKIHVILLGFDVIHPCHFPIILTAFGHEFLSKKNFKKKSLPWKKCDNYFHGNSMSFHGIKQTFHQSLFCPSNLIEMKCECNVFALYCPTKS